jgi:predicted hydrocarbon binding protein
MKRKDFLSKLGITGVCACSGSILLAGDTDNAAEKKEPPKEDGRIVFSKTRYARLMEILQSRLTEDEFEEIIQALGRECSDSMGLIKKYKGDPEGYLDEIKRSWHEDAVYDKENGIITVASEKRTECICPLIDTKNVSEEVCHCSIGWQKQTFETVLQKKVDVKIKESIIRGGERCAFEIKVLD